MTDFQISITMNWGQIIQMGVISAPDEKAALREAKARYFLPGRGFTKKSFTATAQVAA